MADNTGISNQTKRMIIIMVLSIALTLCAAIGGSYLVGFHEGAVAGNKAVHAAEVASQGRSKSLCQALLLLAQTDKAHLLHPIFQEIYDRSGCVQVTGKP